jgi:TrmH family RNA methyltransferase
MKVISSDTNHNFRRWLRLSNAPRAVREIGKTLAEGFHLAQAILDVGRPIEAVVVRKNADSPQIPGFLAKMGNEENTYELAGHLFDRISPVEHGSGLIIVLDIPRIEAPILLDEDLVYLDGIQDPGNAGAILRCAAAAGIRRVLSSPGTAALWAPRTLRASMGAHLRLTIHEGVVPDRLVDMFQGDWYAAVAHGGTSLWNIPLPRTHLGWIFGSEGNGPSVGSLIAARHQVHIPTSAAVESLNVAAAAAVCLFERNRRG